MEMKKYDDASNRPEETAGEYDDSIFYGDEDHAEGEEPRKKGAKKSPERQQQEADFLALYGEYIHPTQNYSSYRVRTQLDDLLELLAKLNGSWAYRKAQSYRLAGFHEASGDVALNIGRTAIYPLLQEDRTNGKASSYPIGHYLRIMQNKIIDGYFRTTFGRLSSAAKENNGVEASAEQKHKIPVTVSLDAPLSDNNGSSRSERMPEASVDPFAEFVRSRWERSEKSDLLTMLFLRELMDYPSDPPKPLALMYGNVLFQLYKDYGGEDALSQMAKHSPKLSSPAWAHRRMGRANLLKLGVYSEKLVRKCYSKTLTWGQPFCRHMKERSADGRTWAEIIYTETYTEANTSDWIESIQNSTVAKCARKLEENPELKEYAMEAFSIEGKFRKAMKKLEKGACR